MNALRLGWMHFGAHWDLPCGLAGRGSLRHYTEVLMPDGKANPGGPDRSRIGLKQDQEVRDRCRSLGVSEDELRGAVRTAGNTVPKAQASAHSTPGYQAGRLGRIASVLRFA